MAGILSWEVRFCGKDIFQLTPENQSKKKKGKRKKKKMEGGSDLELGSEVLGRAELRIHSSEFGLLEE